LEIALENALVLAKRFGIGETLSPKAYNFGYYKMAVTSLRRQNTDLRRQIFLLRRQIAKSTKILIYAVKFLIYAVKFLRSAVKYLRPTCRVDDHPNLRFRKT
jgi:hypothetical protein